MKTTLIRFRVSDEEKSRISDFVHLTGTTMSETIRLAVTEAMRGDVPGTKARQASANIRQSSNQLLDVMENNPINVLHLRKACIRLRKAAQQLVQSR